jgi:DNA-binding NarL/FixJ family response regulator
MDDRKPRVLLADDHKIITECLAHVLEPCFELVGTAENGQELIEAAERLRPDVALVDISMPDMNGIEAARQMSQRTPATKVIFLTMHTGLSYVEQAFRAGASGYVLKRSAAAELVTGIREVLAGRRYVTPIVNSQFGRPEVEPTGVALTSRQQAVLELVAEGLSAKEIASSLNISPKTVEFHKAAIMDKLAMHTTAQLMRYAMKNGITRNDLSWV